MQACQHTVTPVGSPVLATNSLPRLLTAPAGAANGGTTDSAAHDSGDRPSTAHAWSTLSMPTWSPAHGATKNHVVNRAGAFKGGVQWLHTVSDDRSTVAETSSAASRTAAERAFDTSSSPSSASSIRPPGKTHIPAKAPTVLRCSIKTSKPQSTSEFSRVKMTVAAGRLLRSGVTCEVGSADIRQPYCPSTLLPESFWISESPMNSARLNR